ncbi:Phytochrome-like protein cph1 [Planctomycetes bacterium CA13]|uniref:histidine kinase n=1 Tax=Novipirellula herctigrandis TaxID=2527986 RepID=A0A5C5YW63_9BACT|nr:Phytochrome-like protein cph1 [Planctomycetes bacterium CA13]
MNQPLSTQQVLHQLQSRLDLALSGGNVGLWDWDLETDLVFFSDQWHRQIGEPPGSLSDYQAWESRVHADDLADAVARVRNLLGSSQNEYESTFRLRHRSGEYRWILARGQLFRNESGKPIRLLGIHLDITNEKRHEQRLRNDLYRSEMMLQTLESTLHTTSLDTLCKIVCAQTRQLLQTHLAGIDLDPTKQGVAGFSERSYSVKYQDYKRDAFPVDNVTVSDDVASNPVFDRIRILLCMSQQQLETNSISSSLCQATDLRPALRGLLACPLVDVHGNRLGVIWLSDKVSGGFNEEDQSLLRQLAYIVSILIVRIRIEEQLRRQTELLDASNEELQQFAYIASHDLQQPLRAIGNYAEFLNEDYKHLLGDEGKRLLDAQIAATQRMRALIDDLLLYSRVNRDESGFSNCNFNEVLSDAMRRLEVMITESNAHIQFADLPNVNGVHSRLVQLMQNLISNSIKYRSSERPVIKISAIQQENAWLFTIIDNGIGIDETYHQDVFQVFRRLHNDSEIEGTGIGLAICKRIVNRHGGEIWISPSQDTGTQICFQIAK